jgi:phage/plasmid primase-like uncharacterized protein
VHLTGERAGVWADFGTGETGDALDLVAARLYGGNVAEAMAWARRWLGLGDAPVAAPRAAPAPETAADEEAEQRRGAARRMWLAARADLTGTPVAQYLAGRGIELADLARQPGALRCHFDLFNRESGRTWPAMLGAIVGADGRHVATHRTWLAPAPDGVWRKAPLRDPKMTLGGYVGGCIPLSRGASGKPLAKAAAGESVAIAEGIETALSVAIGCPELRVLSAVSLANMARLALPPAVGTVILCVDNDPPGSPAARALQRAVDALAAQGREVRIARSPVGKDFNDALTKDGE